MLPFGTLLLTTSNLGCTWQADSGTTWNFPYVKTDKYGGLYDRNSLQVCFVFANCR